MLTHARVNNSFLRKDIYWMDFIASIHNVTVRIMLNRQDLQPIMGSISWKNLALFAIPIVQLGTSQI
jgi:hypothetical protein